MALLGSSVLSRWLCSGPASLLLLPAVGFFAYEKVIRSLYRIHKQ